MFNATNSEVRIQYSINSKSTLARPNPPPQQHPAALSPSPDHPLRYNDCDLCSKIRRNDIAKVDKKCQLAVGGFFAEDFAPLKREIVGSSKASKIH